MPADLPPATTADRQAERLAQLAAAARPVQHDLNNLLTVIFANLEMLQRSTTEETPKRRLLRVQEAARRFESTTRAILSLSRRQIPDETVISPAAAVTALEPLLALMLSAPGALTVAAEPSAPACRFDQSLLDETLLGLATGLAGSSLAITVADEAERAVLTLALPSAAAEAGEAAAARLRLLARTAGGALAREDAPDRITLRLTLPRAGPGP